MVLTAFLLCTPLAFNWNQTIKGGRCANQPATFIAVGVLDLAVDCAVVVLPLPSIYKLQTSKGNKLALFGIFGLGLVCSTEIQLEHPRVDRTNSVII